jgi:hypothetical protein
MVVDATEQGPTDFVDVSSKRSIARRFNDTLAGRSPKAKSVDQRTARRLNRFRNELKNGKKAGNRELNPLDVALRVHTLLESGARLTDLRRLTKPRDVDYNEETMVALLREMHPEYGFSPDAYRFAGVRDETLVAAGVLDKMPPRRGRPAKER